MGNAPIILGDGNKTCPEKGYPYTIGSNCTLTIGEGIDPSLAAFQAAFAVAFLVMMVLSIFRLKETRAVPEKSRNAFHTKLYVLCSVACFFLLLGLVDPFGWRGMYGNGTVYFVVDEVVSAFSTAPPHRRRCV